jgi:large subunit ribosomal protein L37Ae
MSKRTKKVGTSGRYSSRYGVKSRTMIREVENQQRRRHECPQCGQKTVQRTSTSIWTCSKCGNIFAGGAYLPATPAGIAAERALKAIPVETHETEESP